MDEQWPPFSQTDAERLFLGVSQLARKEPFGRPPPTQRKMRPPLHPDNQRCRPLHAHHPHRAQRGPVEDQPAFGPPAPLGFTGENGAQSLQFFAFRFFQDTSIPKTENPFSLLFELLYLFISFFQEIAVNHIHRPFCRPQQFPNPLGACRRTGGVSIIAIQIGTSFAQPEGLRVIAQANDRYQALQQGAHKPFIQELIQHGEEGQQKRFKYMKQVLRASLRVLFQAFEGFRQFCHNDNGSPRSGVDCFHTQQSKRGEPFCLAFFFFLAPGYTSGSRKIRDDSYVSAFGASSQSVQRLWRSPEGGDRASQKWSFIQNLSRSCVSLEYS